MASDLTITIRGPQGHGKTTLANALKEMLAECDVHVTLVDEEQYDDAAEELMYLATQVDMRVRIETEQEP